MELLTNQSANILRGNGGENLLGEIVIFDGKGSPKQCLEGFNLGTVARRVEQDVVNPCSNLDQRSAAALGWIVVRMSEGFDPLANGIVIVPVVRTSLDDGTAEIEGMEDAW